jgi:hypothetical protein
MHVEFRRHLLICAGYSYRTLRFINMENGEYLLKYSAAREEHREAISILRLKESTDRHTGRRLAFCS